MLRLTLLADEFINTPGFRLALETDTASMEPTIAPVATDPGDCVILFIYLALQFVALSTDLCLYDRFDSLFDFQLMIWRVVDVDLSRQGESDRDRSIDLNTLSVHLVICASRWQNITHASGGGGFGIFCR